MTTEKLERLNEIKKLIHNFCETNLNKEVEGFSMNLCEDLGEDEGINLSRGKIEIWAASIIYVIARLNYLFDKENDAFISADILCDYFNAKKSTIGNKATQIEKQFDLDHEIEKYCHQEIIDSFTFYETPEGFLIPKNAADTFGIYEFADKEESRAIEKLFEEKKKIEAQKALEKKKQRLEINRKIAADKKRKKMENDTQMDLFGDN